MSKKNLLSYALRLLFLSIALITVGLISGCPKQQNSASKTAPRIGILQDKPQEWADALKLGFTDGLIEQGFNVGDDIIVVSRSATGDPQALTTIADTFVQGDYDIVYSLGTQCTQEVFRKSSTKSIIFGAVTDPVKAGFYKGSLNKPSGNITGTQDLWPYPAQFELIQKLIPGVKRIGIVYNPSEVNSQVSVAHIKAEAKKRKLHVEERTVTSESEIQTAVSAVLNRNIDVFFIPADNTAQTASPSIIALTQAQKVPVFTGIPGIVEGGALATVGTNYYELGKVNARQAAEIIKNGKQAKDIPVAIAEKGDVYINLKTAKKLGISIPNDTIKKAFKVYR